MICSLAVSTALCFSFSLQGSRMCEVPLLSLLICLCPLQCTARPVTSKLKEILALAALLCGSHCHGGWCLCEVLGLVTQLTMPPFIFLLSFFFIFFTLSYFGGLLKETKNYLSTICYRTSINQLAIVNTSQHYILP